WIGSSLSSQTAAGPPGTIQSSPWTGSRTSRPGRPLSGTTWTRPAAPALSRRADALQPRTAAASTWRGVGGPQGPAKCGEMITERRYRTMREVDFRYLQGALESLNSSTDLVLVRGRIQAVLSHQASPYASHRQVRFEMVAQPLGDDVLLAANYRKILLVGLSEGAVKQAAESVGREGRPFSGSLLGWDG